MAITFIFQYHAPTRRALPGRSAHKVVLALKGISQISYHPSTCITSKWPKGIYKSDLAGRLILSFRKLIFKEGSCETSFIIRMYAQRLVLRLVISKLRFGTTRHAPSLLPADMRSPRTLQSVYGVVNGQPCFFFQQKVVLLQALQDLVKLFHCLSFFSSRFE